MVQKINLLQSFGSFKNFSWHDDSEFKKFNLFYGWNGSGKTTLSKLFTLLEQKDDIGLIKNLTEYKFNIKTSELNITETNYKLNNLNLHVFNEIFLKNNLNWNDVVKSILLISDEVITEKKELETYKRELGGIEPETGLLGEIKNNTNNLKTINSEIDKFFQKSAKKIKEEFKIIDTSDTYYFNYDKKKFSSFINQEENLVTDKQNILKPKYIDELKESIRPNILDVINLDLKVLNEKRLLDVQDRVIVILKKSLIVKEITRLKEYAKIGEWVEKGIEIHKQYNSKKCEFCNQLLPESRINELEKHFSDEFMSLKEKILIAIDWLPGQKINLEILNDELEFYPEFKEEFKKIKKELDIAIENINKYFDIWSEDLKNKLINPFEIKNKIIDINKQEIDKYNSLIHALNTLIFKHNNKTNNFNEEARKLKNKLELHYATLFYHEFSYKTKFNAIVKLEKDLELKKNQKEELEHKILRLEELLSNEAIGAKEFNEKLYKFLGRKNIFLKYDKNSSGYRIIRDGKEATNLSEGEKTAISFVYFVTKLKENDNKIENSIIVVDDPISSFDSNNLFSAYSFLKNECEKARQLFVITHNFSYFKLVRDWFLGARLDKFGRTSIYTIITKLDNDIRVSILKKADDSLIKYNSEYHYIFSKLYSYKGQCINQDNAYLIGNLLRKLLEAFLTFKYPLKRDNFKSLFDVGVKDIHLNERVYRFINKYSHNQCIDFYESSDDTVLSESLAIVDDVFEQIIKKIDSVHYIEMEKMVIGNS